MTPAEGKRLVALKDVAVEHFGDGDLMELGAVTGMIEYVRNPNRLLRSLSFQDPDYGAQVFDVLAAMVARDPGNIEVIESFLAKRFDFGGTNVSSIDRPGRRVYFTPAAFEIPDGDKEPDLLSAMMPFEAGFTSVHSAIATAAERNSMRCLRADDIWDHSNVIQDVFSLIFRSQIVVCDFTGKNANVFYEAGIAHTLGKHVIPITQNSSDIPFDLQSHRYLSYLNNTQGHQQLTDDLTRRIRTLSTSTSQRPWSRGRS